MSELKSVEVLWSLYSLYNHEFIEWETRVTCVINI